MRHKDFLGRQGEEAAARYLTAAGWQILDRNWRCGQGEIDIVARDGRDLVVCEVKTRSSTAFGTPVEAVSLVKLARLRRLAQAWLAEQGISGAPVRVDVLGMLARGTDRFAVDHMRGCA
jgi:putative endonuclease